MGDLLHDPFLVSVHIITDPGEAKTLQSAVDRLLSLLHPQLTLFRVSERAERPKLRPQCLIDCHPSLRPYLSVILFLQEDYGETSHEQHLRRPPWIYHHTEQVKGLSRSPQMQDFFILAPGTPLWALRQVHYGKDIVRFTIYCRNETYSDQVHLYRLLLCRPFTQMNRLYSFCVIYSNHHMEIQLSLKRLPQGQDPTHTECTLIEMRVKNINGLIPLLPHPCRSISDTRWQTKDYDGNKILLQIQALSEQSRDTIHYSLSSETPSFPPSNNYGHDSFSLTMPRFRINVDSLVGAEETDVDTGQAVISKSVDLSVVSVYLLPQKQINPTVPQALSQPPQLFSIASPLHPSNKMSLLPKSVCALQANSEWNRDKHQSNGADINKDCTEEGKQEEFFI